MELTPSQIIEEEARVKALPYCPRKHQKHVDEVDRWLDQNWRKTKYSIPAILQFLDQNFPKREIK